MTTIEPVLAFTGCAAETWAVVNAGLGIVPNLRTFGLLPPTVLTGAIAQARLVVPGSGEGGQDGRRELSAVEAVTVAYSWRVARRVLLLPDEDPLAPQQATCGSAPQGQIAGPPAFPAAGAEAQAGPPVKRIKCSSVIDQSDETEVRQLGTEKVRGLFAQHVVMTGAEPLSEAEPSPEQLSALLDKVVHRDEEPYADFSVLTPFGRRVQRALRLRSWLLQPDGTYKAVEVPGPPSYVAWLACWKVYRSVLFMLQYPADAILRLVDTNVVTPAALEEYSEHYSQLQAEFPECWHLCAVAEDRCRGELFPRLRRELERLHSAGRSLHGITFDPRQPWAAVFVAAARDEAYWDREVRRPALAFLTRGSANAMPTLSPQAAEAVSGVMGVPRSQSNTVARLPGQGISRKAQKRRQQAAAKPQAGQAAPPGSSGGSGRKGPPKGPRGPGGGGGGPPHVVTKDGTQICFKFAKGGRVACSDVCPNGRAHVCQFCLQPHSNSECDQQRSDSGGRRY